MAAPNDVILWHYRFSPYARKVVWYLALRGIEYGECLQPNILPRPDVNNLGLSYRRIPLLSIGRDIYLDTRLIIQKLEAHFPTATSSYRGKLGSDDPQDQFIEELVRRYVMESDLFKWVGGLVPPDMVNDPKFHKDRDGFWGRTWKKEDMLKGRGECLVYVKNVFGFLEHTVLADGREWILKGKEPSLTDIEAIWPLDWLSDMEGALPPDVVSASQYPKVFAWMDRFRAAVKQAKSLAPKPTILEGAQAIEHILNADYVEPEGVDATDPQAFKHGTELEIEPADWKTGHRDRGRLVKLAPDEVALAAKSRGGKEIRIHAPRTGFKITEVDRSTKL